MNPETSNTSRAAIFKRDYENLKAGAWLRLYDVRYIAITGGDRLLFLHHVLTQDLKNLKPGQSALAAMLHATGKTLFLCEVLVLEDKILLLLEKSVVEKAFSLLDRLVIADDVQLENVSQQFGLFLYTGKEPRISELGTLFSSHLFFPDSTGFLFPESQTSIIEKYLSEIQAVFTGQDAYEYLRLEKGIRRYGIDLGEDIILSEAGLDHGAWVSETKGCYPGQEVIAKIKTYKGLRRKIHLFQWEHSEAPALNTPVFSTKSGQAAGIIKSAAPGEDLGKGLGWCYLPEPWPRGESLFFKIGSREVPVEILDFKG